MRNKLSIDNIVLYYKLDETIRTTKWNADKISWHADGILTIA